MIPNDQPLRKETIDRMLTSVNDPYVNILTSWESEFVSSVSEQFESKGDLSVRQCEILEGIYDKL